MPHTAVWATERARYRSRRHGLFTAIAILCEVYSGDPEYRPEWAPAAAAGAVPEWLEDIARQWMSGQPITARPPAKVQRVWVSYCIPVQRFHDGPGDGRLRFTAHVVLDDGTEFATDERPLSRPLLVLPSVKGASNVDAAQGSAVVAGVK
ncbi:hypothetical protein AB0J63_20925 [Streptosporangium canum]|uniref:hypothetical protein n=1 Tax=Streptosporangium canum TaxID=324952 RepID=UPI003414E822